MDARNQLKGKVSKAKGADFERRIDQAFEYYRKNEIAVIEKTPEPMRVKKNLGNGNFVAFCETKAQPDYKGVLKGGQAILFEAKYTSGEKIEQSRVTPEQAAYLEECEAMGALCYVLVGFGSGNVYCIPWIVWEEMKEIFGRKYAKEEELASYRVPLGWAGIPLVLGRKGGGLWQKRQGT